MIEGKVKFKAKKEDKAKEKRQIKFLIAIKYTSSYSVISQNAKHLKFFPDNTYILFQKERKIYASHTAMWQSAVASLKY